MVKAVSIDNKPAANKKRASRRRKKRRTEDFSSSESDSSSDSSDDDSEHDSKNDNDNDIEMKDTEQLKEKPKKKSDISSIETKNVELHNVVEEDVVEGKGINKLSNELKKKLNEINLHSNKNTNVTKISFESIQNSEEFLKRFAVENLVDGGSASRINSETQQKLQPSKTIEKSSNHDANGNSNSQNENKKSELLDEYLSLMMGNYEADLDDLRKANDLNEFSLPILANLLREGGNIFDYESLSTIVTK
ncbi:hypothetical protein DASC09_062360 [Saccharomycopsis crataegensis]|uniref:Ribosome assembly protein 3 n=1 Tax=Saccharomycopsis crataegensis TaxID=43959 RepID=A0AAV5QWG0_9ASCO|nr:hypothetical protein DASC09_062360 [Saccharomycopsis crataegensis]